MFGLAIKILGYLPYEFMWVYLVFIIVVFALLIRLLIKLIGGI